jgi:hypothetical protein
VRPPSANLKQRGELFEDLIVAMFCFLLNHFQTGFPTVSK